MKIIRTNYTNIFIELLNKKYKCSDHWFMEYSNTKLLNDIIKYYVKNINKIELSEYFIFDDIKIHNDENLMLINNVGYWKLTYNLNNEIYIYKDDKTIIHTIYYSKDDKDIQHSNLIKNFLIDNMNSLVQNGKILNVRQIIINFYKDIILKHYIYDYRNFITCNDEQFYTIIKNDITMSIYFYNSKGRDYIELTIYSTNERLIFSDKNIRYYRYELVPTDFKTIHIREFCSERGTWYHSKYITDEICTKEIKEKCKYFLFENFLHLLDEYGIKNNGYHIL